MTIKGSKSIAEYAFRKWMENEGFVQGFFSLEMTGMREAVITDRSGDRLMLNYENGSVTLTE